MPEGEAMSKHHPLLVASQSACATLHLSGEPEGERFIVAPSYRVHLCPEDGDGDHWTITLTSTGGQPLMVFRAPYEIARHEFSAAWRALCAGEDHIEWGAMRLLEGE